MWTQALKLFFQGRRKRRSPPRKNKPMYSHRTLSMSEWQTQIHERPRHMTFMDLSLLLDTFYENWLLHICEHWRKVHLTWSNCDARPLSEPIYYECTFCCIPRPLVPQAKELVSGHQHCVILQSPSHRVTSRKESLTLWSKDSSRKQSCVAIIVAWLAYVKRSPEFENCHVKKTLSHPPEHDDSYVEPRSQVGKALLHKDKPDSRHLLPWKWFHLLWTEKDWGWYWDRK